MVIAAGTSDIGGMKQRTDMHRLVDLVRLHRMDTPPREVARLLVMGPNTERQYRQALEAEGLLHGDPTALPALEVLKMAVEKRCPPALPPQQVSSLEPLRSWIEDCLAKRMKPRAIYDRLRLEHAEFRGSYSAMKRFCRALGRARGVQPEDVAIAVETAAGEVAQVDFGYVGKLIDPETHTLRKAWCFVMVLGFSRHMVVRVVFDQRTETWLRLHVEAFEELGGVPKTIVPDNLKAAVIRAAFGVDDPTELNRSYRELARYYGFKVDPTPPRDPEKKGKVEAGVKYVKRNFFSGREGAALTDVRRDLARWVTEIAGLRTHGTTGKRPVEVFTALEQASLLKLPSARYEIVIWKKATVHQDSHVAMGERLYSVPWNHIGAEVWIRAVGNELAVYCNDERIALHARRGSGYRTTVDAHLPEHRVDLRHRSREYWEERAAKMGDDVLAFVREVFDSDDVLLQLRAVQGIVTHLETFPLARAQAACKRASHFGCHTIAGLKTILRKALDLEPVPPSSSATPATSTRFSRPASYWGERAREDSHELH